MIIAAWDSSTTAILVGIAGGIVGVVGPAVVALYSKWSSASLKAEAERLALAVKRSDDRGDRLEERVWKLEEKLLECEKGRSRLEALLSEWKPSHPKSGDE